MDPAEQFLLQFHNEAPGGTPETFGWMRDQRGHSSYDWLADMVQPGDAVLDLCCGDGVLLATARARGATSLIGIDFSPAELAEAGLRLGDAAVLHLARAQQLAVADASVDLVLCHMALMLLSPVEPALAEVARVLKPGGRFAVVVGTGPATGAWATLVTHLRACPWRLPKLGDARTRRAEDLRALLRDHFTDVAVDARTVSARGSLDQLWSHFMRTYNAPTLDADELLGLREKVAAELGEGDLGWGTPMLLAVAAR